MIENLHFRAKLAVTSNLCVKDKLFETLIQKTSERLGYFEERVGFSSKYNT